MTRKIEPDALKITLYTPGGFVEAPGQDLHNDKNGIAACNIPMGVSDGTDVVKLFKQGFNPLSFSLKVVGDAEKELKFGPRADDTQDIVYLPYVQNSITSTVIPTNTESSVRYFITDPMSGCNFFIDRLRNGNLVCHHANAMRYSPTKADLKANAGAFTKDGVDMMTNLHDKALSEVEDYRGAERVTELRVANYYRKAQTSVNEKAAEGDCTDVTFAGGAIIMGFMEAGKWRFYFQTYSRNSYRSKKTGITGKIMDMAKGKGKEAPLKSAPLKIIDTECFWHD